MDLLEAAIPEAHCRLHVAFPKIPENIIDYNNTATRRRPRHNLKRVHRDLVAGLIAIDDLFFPPPHPKTPFQLPRGCKRAPGQVAGAQLLLCRIFDLLTRIKQQIRHCEIHFITTPGPNSVTRCSLESSQYIKEEDATVVKSPCEGWKVIDNCILGLQNVSIRLLRYNVHIKKDRETFIDNVSNRIMTHLRRRLPDHRSPIEGDNSGRLRARCIINYMHLLACARAEAWSLWHFYPALDIQVPLPPLLTKLPDLRTRMQFHDYSRDDAISPDAYRVNDQIYCQICRYPQPQDPVYCHENDWHFECSQQIDQLDHILDDLRPWFCPLCVEDVDYTKDEQNMVSHMLKHYTDSSHGVTLYKSIIPFCQILGVEVGSVLSRHEFERQWHECQRRIPFYNPLNDRVELPQYLPNRDEPSQSQNGLHHPYKHSVRFSVKNLTDHPVGLLSEEHYQVLGGPDDTWGQITQVIVFAADYDRPYVDEANRRLARLLPDDVGARLLREVLAHQYPLLVPQPSNMNYDGSIHKRPGQALEPQPLRVDTQRTTNQELQVTNLDSIEGSIEIGVPETAAITASLIRSEMRNMRPEFLAPGSFTTVDLPNVQIDTEKHQHESSKDDETSHGNQRKRKRLSISEEHEDDEIGEASASGESLYIEQSPKRLRGCRTSDSEKQ